MKSNKTVNGKTTWRWTAHGGQAVEVMLTLYPMMGERRKGKIAECMLYWRSIPLRRKWFKT